MSIYSFNLSLIYKKQMRKYAIWDIELSDFNEFWR